MHFNGYAFENALCEHAGCLVSTIMGIYQIARRQLWVGGRPYVVDAKESHMCDWRKESPSG